MQFAKRQGFSDLGSGLVLDYEMMTSQTNFTFKGNMTYLVLNTVLLSGTKTVIEGGTVVKYTNSPTVKIVIATPIECQTAPYRPAIFTSWRDNTVGETIPRQRWQSGHQRILWVGIRGANRHAEKRAIRFCRNRLDLAGRAAA